MAAKIFRINYKSDFILTLNSDAGWMTPFCIKFWTGAPSQAFFAQWDGETYIHCAYDPSEPTKLLVQFDDHHLPIGELKYQVAYHFTVADFPNDTEDEVLNQANITTEIDGETYQVMLDFTGETAPEIQFSLPAYANEQQRIANEQQRIAQEQIRQQNEQQRIAQEQIRQQNEQQRINQEQARVNEYAGLKADAVAATGAANDAAALANQKAQLAADKADLAQDASDLANAKAQLAADKAALAESAATLANQKAALAQQKAEYAQEQGTYSKNQGDYAKEQGDYSKAQGDYAKDQGDYSKSKGDYAKDQGDYSKSKGDYAKDQGDYSKQQGDYAKEQGEICAADHLVAVEDHQTAAADHQTATTDHSTALSDHTQAANDHTRAESDHAAVEVYIDSLGVFDLSKHNAVGGVLATYADLSAALTALNALDSQYKYGGMSFKFVQSSDNNYIKFFCTADEFTTDVTKWQGVDEEPTVNSNNLVKSGGVKNALDKKVTISSLNVFNPDALDNVSGYISGSSGNITAFDTYITTGFIPVIGGQTYYKATDSNKHFRKSLMYSDIGTPITASYVGDDADSLTVPIGAKYMRVTLYVADDKKQISILNTTYRAYNPISMYVYNILGLFDSNSIATILSRITAIESFDAGIPINDILHLTENVFSVANFFIDNHCYNSAGNLSSADTYACTEKLKVTCSYCFKQGFIRNECLCYQDSTYLGQVSADSEGKFTFLENTNYIAFNFQKSQQPSGYKDNGIIYNFEPYIPVEAINNRIKALETFKNNVPLDSIKHLTKWIFNIKDYFIDNKYYKNDTGGLSSADTYACTEKIPFDGEYVFGYGFYQGYIHCWDANNVFLGVTSRFLENGVYRYNTISGTAYIAFNFQKSAQPEDYQNNGFFFNLLPFVVDYAPIIEAERQSNVLYKKKWCVVGDSFSVWSDEEFVGGRFNGEYKTYKHFIALRNDMVLQDLTASGRTMAYPSDHTFNNAFAKPELYQSIASDADYITIMLGINDVAHLAGYSPDGESAQGYITLGDIDSVDTGTFYGAWNVVMQWIFENRPLAHVGIIITNGLGSQGPSGSYGEVGMQIYTAIKDIVQKWNVPAINLNGGDGKTPMMQRGIYPQGTPASLIAAKWNAFATSPTEPYNGHTNAAGHLYESTFIENFLRSL